MYATEAITGSFDGVTDLARYAKTAPKKIPTIYKILHRHMKEYTHDKEYSFVCNIVYAMIELVKQCPHALSYLEKEVITTVTYLLRKPLLCNGLYPYLAYMLVCTIFYFLALYCDCDSYEVLALYLTSNGSVVLSKY